MRIDTLFDVAYRRLCVGCGACAFICPKRNVRLKDVDAVGILPEVIDAAACKGCDDCLKVCPAYDLDYRPSQRPGSRLGSPTVAPSTVALSTGAPPTAFIPELLPAYGPILEVWEGHAADPQIRYQGSSGGAITALAFYCLEKGGMHGTLHIGPDPANPVKNITSLSRTRVDLMRRAGSRYAPASACDRLDLIEQAPAPCVFIGKPAEVAALRKAQALRPGLNRNVGLAISFFCAGTPPTRATADLLEKMGLSPVELSDLRYRGHGWPGHFAPTRKGEAAPAAQMTYRESWAFLQAYRPYAMHLWPDDSGELADISCGDPWYRQVEPGEPGSSLVVVRTEAGREIVKRAIAAGYLELTPAEPWKLIKSQEGFIKKRGSLWGRRLAFTLLGLPVTRLQGFPLFHFWLRLPLKDKLKSTLGTLRRIIQRKYYKPLKY